MPPHHGDRGYGQHVPPGAAQGQHAAVASESGGDFPKHPPGVQGQSWIYNILYYFQNDP